MHSHRNGGKQYKSLFAGWAIGLLLLSSCRGPESRSKIVGHTIRYVIAGSVRDCIGGYVKDHQELPASLSSLGCKNLLRDPIHDDRFLSYERFTPFSAIIYSFGFDDEDNNGRIPYNSFYDSLISLPDLKYNGHYKSTDSLYSEKELELIKGDICFFLFVDIDTNSQSTRFRMSSIYDDVY